MMPSGVYKRTAKHRHILRAAHKGKTLSAAHRRAISKALMGRPSWNRGKKMSIEFGQKVSAALKGRARPDNSRRMKLTQKGEGNYQHKLTVRQVQNIRYCYKHYRSKSGMQVKPGICQALADEYGVSKGTISMIGNNQRWEHIRKD